MLTLCVFGITIGKKFGSAYLLKLYLAGAFVGSAFFLVHTSFLALSSKNKGSNKHNPSKVCGLGASAAVKPIMLLHVILYSRQKMHNKLTRAILLGMSIFGSDVIMLATQKHTTLTLSAHMGGCLVAAIAWSRIKRGRF
ncbi:rhomboid-like protein 12, mitochondrial [Tanacetum coccineum]